MSVKDLDTLWIINNKGLCFLQQAFNGEEALVDKTIFSGFVTALLNFSDNVFSDSLEKISMGKQDLFCMPFCKGQFYVIVSAKRDADEKLLTEKIQDVGLAFEAEYGNCSEHQVFFEDQFAPFADTINSIFDTETTTIISEHEEFLLLLQDAENNNFTENQTIEAILDFFERLSKTKRRLLLQSTLSILTIFTESQNLTYEQIKRFEKIYSIDDA